MNDTNSSISATSYKKLYFRQFNIISDKVINIKWHLGQKILTTKEENRTALEEILMDLTHIVSLIDLSINS